MTALFVIVGGILGAALGSAAGHSLGTFGLLTGIAIGALLARQRDLAAQLRELRQQLSRMQHAAPEVQRPASTPAPSSSSSSSSPASSPHASASAPATVAEQVAELAPPAPTRPAPDWPPRQQPAAANSRAASAPDPVANVLATIKRWFTEGNVPVKVGMLVLFAGVGALLKYAASQGWLRLPIGLRLAGLALLALAALAFGWRERMRRRAFGLTLQGGAIGVLLMIVFGAFRLYDLLPAGIAFALLVLLVAATAALALWQDSIALAVLALLAGFAAPILASRGNGSHVVLFAYYTLFNSAIFAIAWLRSWRVLNLLGFTFTFLIGVAWGVLHYSPALFGSVEPFLIAFFAIYLAIPIVHGLRQPPARRDPVDGTLVFGNPLLAFALQAGLLEGERVPLAESALALAALYTLLAWRLLPRVRVLAESFAALAAIFATLAVPLALSAWATACTFALEGAALLWLGFRQQQRLPRWSGLALQGLAALAYLYSLQGHAGAPETLAVLNGSAMSALLIAVAGFVSAWLFTRHDAYRENTMLLYLWGLAWWGGLGWREIDRFVPFRLQAPALLAFIALTAYLAAFAWPRLRRSALAWTAAMALAFGILLMFGYAANRLRPWEPWPLAALAAYALFGFLALRSLRTAPSDALGIAHPGWVWTWTLALALAAHRLGHNGALGNSWRTGLTILPLLLAWLLVLLRPRWIAPPLVARFDAWRAGLATSQALVAAALFLFTLFAPGNARPLPWIPLANPLELVQLGILLCAARWLAAPTADASLIARRPVLLGLAAFLFVTAATLRGVHHLGGLPWNARLWSAVPVQTALTIVWSVLGVAGWVTGSRRGSRALWLCGAVLMGVVLAKLLLVDRDHLGSVLGIVSFIAYGLLCTLIGYLAPAPPRDAASLAN